MENESILSKLATFFERALRPNEANEIATYHDGRLLLTRDDSSKPRFSLVFNGQSLDTHHSTLESFIEWIDMRQMGDPIDIWCNSNGVHSRYDCDGINPDGDVLSLTNTHAFRAIKTISEATERKAFFKPGDLWSLLVSKLADAGAGTEELTLQLSEVTLHSKGTAKDEIGKIGIKQISSRSTTMELAFADGKTELPTTIQFDLQIWNEVPDLRIPVSGRLEAKFHNTDGLLIGIHIEDLDAALLRALALLQSTLAKRLPKLSVFCGHTLVSEVYKHESK